MANQELMLRAQDNWVVLQQEAEVALQSGYLPQTIKTSSQAIAIAMAGRELGISVWRALNGINIISGKTSLSSELMAELIYTHHGGRSLTIETSTATECTISYQRKDGGPRRTYTYTMAMADRAGLGTNANYKKNPEAMLRARCISSIARMAFPDTIAGCYVEGEIVDDESRLTVVEETSEPRQLNPRNANEQTGEITPADDDSKLAGPKTLAALDDLKTQYDSLSLDTPAIAIPTGVTRGQARALTAELKRAITEYTASLDDSIEGVV